MICNLDKRDSDAIYFPSIPYQVKKPIINFVKQILSIFVKKILSPR